jgi:hypothetical protein
MARARRPGTTEDGVRVVRGRRASGDRWLVVAAVVGMAAAVAVLASRGEGPRDGTAASAPKRARIDDGGAHRAVAEREPEAAPAVDPDAIRAASPRRQRLLVRRLARALPRTRGPEGRPEIAAADAIAALRAAGVRDGIAAFPPPGTDPPKAGVIVPDDVELPEGYLRHYQTTDEGQALPPILLLHPDYELLDETGAPVAVPPDRVVPPELVPPGIPVRMLEVPTGATDREP